MHWTPIASPLLNRIPSEKLICRHADKPQVHMPCTSIPDLSKWWALSVTQAKENRTACPQPSTSPACTRRGNCNISGDDITLLYIKVLSATHSDGEKAFINKLNEKIDNPDENVDKSPTELHGWYHLEHIMLLTPKNAHTPKQITTGQTFREEPPI